MFSVCTASSANLALVTASSPNFIVVTAPSSSFAVTMDRSSTLKGSPTVPAPVMVTWSAMASKLDLSTQTTVPTASVTNTWSLPPEEISSVKMVPFNMFSVWTASSANLALVTASSSSFAVTMERSSTLKGSPTVPAPVMVTWSAMAEKLDLSIHSTVPEASVTNTWSLPPLNMFSVWTASSANSALVIPSADTSKV